MRNGPEALSFRGFQRSTAPIAALLLVAAALLCHAGGASAQDPYACVDELSDEAVSYRIRTIEKSFADGRYKALGWRIGWIAGYAATAGVQGALAVEARQNDRPWDRFAFLYQAAGGAALALGLAVIPMPGVWGGKRIRKQAADTPGSAPRQAAVRDALARTRRIRPGDARPRGAHRGCGRLRNGRWHRESREVDRQVQGQHGADVHRSPGPRDRHRAQRARKSP